MEIKQKKKNNTTREKNCHDSEEVSETDVTNVIVRYGKVCRFKDLFVAAAENGDRRLCAFRWWLRYSVLLIVWSALFCRIVAMTRS